MDYQQFNECAQLWIIHKIKYEDMLFRNNSPQIVPNPATMEQNMRHMHDIGDVKYQTQYID